MPDTKPIAALILDETFWPRHAISATNQAAIVEAIRAGEVMPPIVINAKSNTVIDGWHRVHAYERLYGPEYEIAVEAKTYRNRAAMLADAIALNVGRGLDLTRWDHVRCAALADEVGLPLDSLAKLLKWRPDRLAAYRDSRMGRTLDDRKLALKRSLRHRINQPLNPVQEAANEHLSGMQPMFHVNQLVTLIDADLMPTDDDHLNARLAHLADLITVWLAGQAPPIEQGA